MERLIDFAQVFFAQRTHCLFQAQLAEKVIVLSLIKISAGGKKLLLRIQHIEVGAHADFLSQLAGLQYAFAGGERLLQRLDLGDTADHTQICLLYTSRCV